jgi:hypothetical protein
VRKRLGSLKSITSYFLLFFLEALEDLNKAQQYGHTN